MCGIIGYTGERPATPILLNGLKRLEYRGYDSAGVAVLMDTGEITVAKVAGRVAGLDKMTLPAAGIGIGHTRWATHGRPNETNAHPHTSCDGKLAIVHNGIIENYLSLRDELEGRGHVFKSETDTEVIAHMLEEAFVKTGDLLTAIRETVGHLDGAYALAAIATANPNSIVAVRNKSPLIAGIGKDGNFIASDVPAILEHTKRVIYLLDGEIIRLTPDSVEVFDLQGSKHEAVIQEVNYTLEDAEKGGYEHFMLKEIHEVPRALHEALRGRLANLDHELDLEGSLTSRDLADAERFLIVACGTSYHAGLMGKVILEKLAGIPVDVQLASEYRYGTAFAGPGTIAIGVSQSGETADTLEALRKAHLNEHKTLAIVNVVGSTMTRECDGVMYVRSGPEIGVAATKTFVNSIISFYLLGIHLAAMRRKVPAQERRRLVEQLRGLPRLVQQVLDEASQTEAFATQFLGGKNHSFFLGRQLAYGAALEGALKLKEISYIHAEGYAAGELKHGPLALLEPGLPVVALTPRDHTYGIMISNIGEVRARDAHVLAISEQSDREVAKVANAVIRIPDMDPFFFVVPAVVVTYLLSYYAAKERGCAIDKPRNLAKSVTVE